MSFVKNLGRFGCEVLRPNFWPRQNFCPVVVSLARPRDVPARLLSSNHISPTVLDPVVTDSLDQSSSFTEEERSEFLALLPNVIKSLTFEGVHYDMPSVNQHLAQCIEYNSSRGKLNRGLMVPHAFRLLTDSDKHTSDNLLRANILGWCVELMQTSLLVADGLIDSSTRRRNQDRWHKQDGVGMMAVNDCLLLETCIYTILHNHFSNQPNYLDTIEAFIYTMRHTAMGQALDLLSCYSQDESKRKCTLEEFTMKRYASINKYRTSYYSFYLPIQLGMGLAGIRDPELYRQARTILLEMGHFFQVAIILGIWDGIHKTVLSGYTVVGKLGTNISDGKCSWMIVLALQRASKEQKQILKRTYGSINPDDVSAVLKVFTDLNLPKLYRTYEEETIRDIMDLINRMSGGVEKRTLNPIIFKSILTKIYQRDR